MNTLIGFSSNYHEISRVNVSASGGKQPPTPKNRQGLTNALLGYDPDTVGVPSTISQSLFAAGAKKTDYTSRMCNKVKPDEYKRPTKYLPGTVQKLQIMQDRASNNLPIFHPDDAKLPCT